MRAFRFVASAGSFAVAAVLLQAATAGAASADRGESSSAAVTNGDGSNTPLGALLGTLSYRGAEHPYLIGNLADAVKRFGATSAQADAARAGLLTNVTALAGQLGGTVAQRATFAAGLTARDSAELAYASAVVAGSPAAQADAKTTLKELAGSFATATHHAVPAVTIKDFTEALDTLNAGDETALHAAALNKPEQFADVEKSSIALGTAMRAVGLLVALQRHDTGVTVKDGLPIPRKGAAYRAVLEQTFTEHVYQTGLFGMAILRNGPDSAAATAARTAENLNTTLDAALLGVLGTGTAHTRTVWNQHITGYGDYLTGLTTGDASEIAASGPLLSGYENAITALVKRAVPAFNTAALRGDYTEHVTGTLAVFRAEKANSATLYPMALMGAHHFSDLATDIADKQQYITG